MQLSDIRTRHNQPVCSLMRSVPCSKIGINLVNVISSVSLLIYDDVLAVSFPTLFLDSCKGTSIWCCLPPRNHCYPSLLYSHTVGNHLLPRRYNEFNYHPEASERVQLFEISSESPEKCTCHRLSSSKFQAALKCDFCEHCCFVLYC